MKKIILLCCSILLLTPTLHANKWKALIPGKKPVTRATFTNNERLVSSQLERRAASSYQKALSVEMGIRELSATQYAATGAIEKVVNPKLSLGIICQNKLLTTPEQMGNYFVARNNRLAIQNARHMETATAWMGGILLPDLQAQQIIPTHPASEDMAWLAAQIPENTRFLLLGEVHDVPAIQQQMANLLYLLRLKYPYRTMILLTEKAPITYVDTGTQQLDPNTSYYTLFSAAQENDILVAGIEPLQRALLDDLQVSDAGDTYSLWGSDEGVRLRNKFWLEHINHLDLEGETLIIINGGYAHLNYVEPNSVGAALQKLGNTFMVQFERGYTQLSKDRRNSLERYSWFKDFELPQGGFVPVSTFDEATQGKFPQRIVYFEPTKIRGYWEPSSITGFDVQIKVPITSSSKY